MPAPRITEDCTMCTACEAECPVGAIHEGLDTYEIDPNVCVQCEGYAPSPTCIDTCPNDAVVMD